MVIFNLEDKDFYRALFSEKLTAIRHLENFYWPNSFALMKLYLRRTRVPFVHYSTKCRGH